jgi:hypothetical protein
MGMRVWAELKSGCNWPKPLGWSAITSSADMPFCLACAMRSRLTQAPEDAAFAFEYAAECATTPQLQALVIRSLQRKCSLLWAQLDALQYCYVEPGSMPPQPSIFRPEAQ